MSILEGGMDEVGWGGFVERVGWRSGVGGRLKGPTVLPHMQAECGRAAYV